MIHPPVLKISTREMILESRLRNNNLFHVGAANSAAFSPVGPPMASPPLFCLILTGKSTTLHLLEVLPHCGTRPKGGGIMFGKLGIPELLIILGIVFFLFGAKRLPEIGKGIGEGIRNFKGAIKKEEQGPKEKNP
jgi:sec-independent protein translocase protein TatA